MRILAVVAIWGVFLGSVSIYMNSRAAPAAPLEFVRAQAKGAYTLELTVSFAVEPDPFALDIDDTQRPAALRLLLDGKEILRRDEAFAAGERLNLSPVPGLVAGRNEFYLEANPPEDALNRAHAARLRILQDGETLAETTFWSDPGSALKSTFTLDLTKDTGPAPAAKDNHGHAH